jgi:hypothetical protein
MSDNYSTFPFDGELSTADYEAMDPPVRSLVAVLNRLSGIKTLSSYGGHDEPISLDSLPADEWYVTVVPEPRDRDADVHAPTDGAWMDLEYLAWRVNAWPWRDKAVELVAYAKPPHLNFPGRMLAFNLQRWRGGETGVGPDDLAESIARDLDDLYNTQAEP